MLFPLTGTTWPRYTNVTAAQATGNLWPQPTLMLRVIITTAGTTAVTFYDNTSGAASGPILAALPATTTVGQNFDFQVAALNGITATGAAGTPAYTLTFIQLNAN